MRRVRRHIRNDLVDLQLRHSSVLVVALEPRERNLRRVGKRSLLHRQNLNKRVGRFDRLDALGLRSVLMALERVLAR